MNEDLDVIKVDVPLFIRLLELAREDLKTDAALHDMVTRVLKLSKEREVLTMEDYPNIENTKLGAYARLRIA